MGDEALNLDRLVKLMGMTTSSQDGEALNAIRLANKMVAGAGGWESVLRGKVRVIADPFANMNIPPRQPPAPQPSYAAPSYAQRPSPSPPRQPAAKPSIVNQFAGMCMYCNTYVAAQAGHATKFGTKWKVHHTTCPSRRNRGASASPSVDNL